MPFSPYTIGRMQTEGGFALNWFLWIEAKNRTTGDPETIGLWDGSYDATHNFDGQTRTYHGALGLFQVGDLTFGTGTLIRTQSVKIGPLTQAVQEAISVYNPRFAPVELHAMISFENDGHFEIDRKFKGFIDKLPQPLPGMNEQPVANLELVSSARLGTRSPRGMKSDETQKERQGDRFRKYGDISGVVPVWWGEGRKVVEGTSAATRPAAIKPSTWGA